MNRETATTEPCDGMCVTAADVGLPGYGEDAIVHAHPGCPRHDPGAVCDCGTPDRCMSPTHGQISHAEALRIRHAQNPSDPRSSGSDSLITESGQTGSQTRDSGRSKTGGEAS